MPTTKPPFRDEATHADGDALVREALVTSDRAARVKLLERALALGTSNDADTHWHCARAASDAWNASPPTGGEPWERIACQHACACLDLDPARVDALLLLASFAGRPELRVALCTRALELAPLHATARYQRAWVFKSLKALGAAREDFERAAAVGGYEGWGDARAEADALPASPFTPGEESADARGERHLREELARLGERPLWSELAPAEAPPIPALTLARDLTLIAVIFGGLAALLRACG